MNGQTGGQQGYAAFDPLRVQDLGLGNMHIYIDRYDRYRKADIDIDR